MSKYVQYQTDEDKYIWIEVETGDEIFVAVEGSKKGGPAGSMLRDASAGSMPSAETLTSAIEEVKPVIEAVTRQAESFSVRPAEVSLNLGLKFTAKVGVVLAKAGTEGTINLGLKWKLDKKAD
ncbi:MAG: CU044_2847 family protein [Pseudomonadota bacterium]